MNPEMAYFIRPCSLPQNPAFFPCKGSVPRRKLGSQAFDITHVFGDDRHGGGGKTEFSPCSQGATGNCRGDELGARSRWAISLADTSRRTSVDLPEPFRPSKATFSPPGDGVRYGAQNAVDSSFGPVVLDYADCADHSNTRYLRASRISHKPNTVKIASANAVYNGSP